MLSVDEDGPGTHVLLIGVGYYHSPTIKTLSDAVNSVSVLSGWWSNDFANGASPLRSLETLSSDSDAGGGTTFEAIAQAVRQWAERASAYTENTAVFHFAGHGLQIGPEHLLLAEDFSATRESGRSSDLAISVQNLLAGLANGPERQLWMFDTSREAPTEALAGAQFRSIFSPRMIESAALRRWILSAASPGDLLYTDREGMSDFTRAFMETVQTNFDRLDTDALSKGMAERVSLNRGNRVAARFEVQSSVPFTLVDRQGAINTASVEHPSGSPADNAENTPPDDFASEVASPQDRRAHKERPARPSPSPSAVLLGNAPVPNTLPGAAGTPRPDLEFLDDDAQLEVDSLGRSTLAVVVARRLHAIWRKSNPLSGAAEQEDRSAFVMHLDAPWGGGKTTFANFVSRVLNPYGYGGRPARFLRERYDNNPGLGAIFVADPPKPGETPQPVPEDFRRPWIIIQYNAWRMEGTSPPWWTFYQVVRKGCFRSILEEGSAPVDLRVAAKPRRRWISNALSWLWLWMMELGWRLWTPKLIVPLVGFVFSALAFLILWKLGLVGLFGEPGKEAIGFSDAVWPGRILAGLGALTVIGGAVSLIMESLVPGADPVAERIGLGRSDPLERFRCHFQKMTRRLRRPILVIVDDLDRCKPAVIVDLVRGIQTILRSPRVVFLVLGDRNWLECAFEAVHTDMAKVVGGVEQTVGARFVEKAIQLSFLLPGLDRANQSAFVSALLSGAGDTSAGTQRAEAGADLRAVARAAAKAKPNAAFDSSHLRTSILATQEGVAYLSKAGDRLRGGAAALAPGVAEAEARRQAAQIVNEEIAIQAAVAPSVEAETAKRLEPLAPWLPSNPRQIKRILNGIALYHAAGLQHPTFSISKRWFQLALWVVLMTEWPTTWRLLTACPELGDVLCDAKPLAMLTKIDFALLPGSVTATQKEVQRILGSPQLMALIAGTGARGGDKLDTAAIRDLLTLTPPNALLPRLPEPEPVKIEDKAAKTENGS